MKKADASREECYIDDNARSDEPVLHRYRITDRAEVFDFIRAMFPTDASARVIRQWAWKYETNPSRRSTGVLDPDRPQDRVADRGIQGADVVRGNPMFGRTSRLAGGASGLPPPENLATRQLRAV